MLLQGWDCSGFLATFFKVLPERWTQASSCFEPPTLTRDSVVPPAPYFTRGQVTGLLLPATDLLASPLTLCFPTGTERIWKVFFPDSFPSKSFLSHMWILCFSLAFYDEIFNTKKIWKNITKSICILNTKIHPLLNSLLFENKLPISCHFTLTLPSIFLLKLRPQYLLKA